MVICGVCINEDKLDFFEKIGAKDSKKLTAKKRSILAKEIKENCHSYHYIVIDAEEIDNRENTRITLNRLEELKMADIIKKLKPNVIYLDAADVNEERFGESILKLLDYLPNNIISKHRADDIYPIVSAASIIAKDTRDTIIDDLKKEFGEIGSGYPSDEKTTAFLRNYIKENKKAPIFARKTWITTKKMLDEELKNKKITDYFK